MFPLRLNSSNFANDLYKEITLYLFPIEKSRFAAQAIQDQTKEYAQLSYVRGKVPQILFFFLILPSSYLHFHLPI
jgi:hypothetical protein